MRARSTAHRTLVDLLQAAAAGQPQEHLGQLLRSGSPAERAQLVHRAARDDLALQDDADAIAHLLRDLERVRAHQDRDAALAHAPEHVLDQARAARIEADHRLVDEHRPRPVQERGAHDEPLLHAVREALDELVLPSRQLEELEHLA